MGKPMNQLSREEKFPLLLGHLAELTVNFDELYDWLKNHQSNKKGSPSEMCKNLSIDDLGKFKDMVIKAQFKQDPKSIIKMMME